MPPLLHGDGMGTGPMARLSAFNSFPLSIQLIAQLAAVMIPLLSFCFSPSAFLLLSTNGVDMNVDLFSINAHFHCLSISVSVDLLRGFFLLFFAVSILFLSLYYLALLPLFLFFSFFFS